MSDFDILFPIPEGNRNADDMGMPASCECGRGDIVTLPNGERCCSDTLRKFELQNGRPYRAVPNINITGTP